MYPDFLERIERASRTVLEARLAGGDAVAGWLLLDKHSWSRAHLGPGISEPAVLAAVERAVLEGGVPKTYFGAERIPWIEATSDLERRVLSQFESKYGKDPTEIASLHGRVWERVEAVSATANLEGISSEELHDLAQAVATLVTAMEEPCAPLWHGIQHWADSGVRVRRISLSVSSARALARAFATAAA